jgi:release factor glutamine methyltransferase
VTEEQRHDFEASLARRAAGEPLQHIVGTAAFRHVEVSVGPGVFIPRPETELLAGWGIERLQALKSAGRHPVLVDLCTGSGAIAKAVADEAPWAVVHAVELSEEALAYAGRNLEGTGVDLRAGDAADAFPDLDGTVDVVLANPPYIPVGEYESVAQEVREHDPPMALWSGEDGLDTVRVVERTAARLLRAGGEVGCEHADSQGERVPAVFVQAGRWRDVRDHADLAGRPRFTTARRA